MASPDESYRARWFLSCKSCHPALAAPVGQSTLDGANGFHRRVRHCHFRECPLGKTPEQLRCFGFAGLNPLRCLGFAGDTIRRGAPIPNRLGHFGTRVKARNPLRSPSPETPRPLQRQTSKRPARFSSSNPKHASSKPSIQTTKGIHRAHQLFRTGTLRVGNHVFSGATFNNFPFVKHQEPIG